MPVSSTRVAEMVKLLENTFRAVNIGLVNELALMCDKMNIDVWEVVDAAKTKPFGFMAVLSGARASAATAFPIDPFYLSWKAKQTGFDPRFIELAGHINAGMPHYVVDKVGEALNTKRKAINGSKVLVAGIAYKRDIDDMRESPALDVMGLLHGKGRDRVVRRSVRAGTARPRVVGPPRHQGRRPHSRRRSRSTTASSSSPTTRRSITTRSCAEADIVVDTRNAIKERHPHVFRLGAPHPEGDETAAISP